VDKRKDKRFTSQLHVKLNSESKTAWGVLGDVSENGLFIKSTRDIDMNSVVNIEIFLTDNTKARLTGIVTRKVDLPNTHRKFGLGIELTQKDVKYKLFLEPFLYQPDTDTSARVA
jgi:uncharacterized 2Fe-2S/4Fe-4S cluster protein (DUF4445 family)